MMRNVCLVNNKSVKGLKNLHFQEHATLDILIFKSCTFLVFVFISFLCKFVIYSECKSSDKKLKFLFKYHLLLKEYKI